MSSDSSAPHVSCLMTTRDRPHFVEQALRCFSRQTYADRELIVVDAGEQALVDEVCGGIRGVHYVRSAPGATYGACLNIAARDARGAIFQLLDDDDYYTPGFLDRSVSALESAGIDGTIAAWDCFYVLLHDQDELRFSGHGWLAGATLCFGRGLWERTAFRDDGGHQDSFFIEDSGATIARVCAPDLYLLVRHGGNSWRNLRGTDVDAYFRSLPVSDLEVSDVVEPADLQFYVTLSRRDNE
jgi:glycosyltransferase involved in cell wall biosynthesis